MTLARHQSDAPAQGRMTQVHAAEEIHNAHQNARAARTVAGRATDAEDCGHLLEMLGLSAHDGKRG